MASERAELGAPGAGEDSGEGEQAHWLVRPESIRLMWQVFAGVLVFVTFAGLLAHIHAYFGIDGTFGFYSWYGFVTCAAMVFGARWLGKLLKVPDDYYEKAQGQRAAVGAAAVVRPETHH